MTTTSHRAEVKPKRIQRKRTRGWRMPEGAVYVGRPTAWGNPFRVQMPIIDSLDSVLRRFRQYALNRLSNGEDEWLEPLRGKDLACWCKEGEPCHADILLELANQ
jgi:hypothetical protein